VKEFLEQLKERLFYYHNATDIPLELRSADGELLESFSEEFRYCAIIREACAERAFCSRMHEESKELALELKDGYIFSCPASLVHFVVPVFMSGSPVCYILAGPVAMDYPDISVVDGVIQGYSLSLNLRRKLYTALNAIPIVEPIRIQHLNKLLFFFVNDLAESMTSPVESKRENSFGKALDKKNGTARSLLNEPSLTIEIPILQKAVAFIDEHFRENLRLENVAAYVGLNPSYLSTIFNRELKISFSSYLTQRRIEEASLLLIQTNNSLSEIAASSGFENQSYFSQSFRKHTGMTPKQYRKTGQIPYSSGR
jgi:AraC-like DNA-binding protein/ligand-binding sensor protein